MDIIDVSPSAEAVSLLARSLRDASKLDDRVFVDAFLRFAASHFDGHAPQRIAMFTAAVERSRDEVDAGTLSEQALAETRAWLLEHSRRLDAVLVAADGLLELVRKLEEERAPISEALIGLATSVERHREHVSEALHLIADALDEMGEPPDASGAVPWAQVKAELGL